MTKRSLSEINENDGVGDDDDKTLFVKEEQRFDHNDVSSRGLLRSASDKEQQQEPQERHQSSSSPTTTEMIPTSSENVDKPNIERNGSTATDGEAEAQPPSPTQTSTSTETTRIIPADHYSGFPNKIQEFSKKFQAKIFPKMTKLYKRALKQDETDRNGWFRGIRLINGNRYEVQVRGDFMKQEFGDFPDQLVDYAESLALKDDRIQNMSLHQKEQLRQHQKQIFSEWSMIISQTCEEQIIHIDVPHDNFQFGLVLQSDDIPGTHVLNDKTLGPHTAEQLFETIWQDAPTELKLQLTSTDTPARLKSNFKESCMQILKEYGPLLLPKPVLDSRMCQAQTLSPEGVLKCGDLICTLGGIPHYGPAYKKFRMVMFGAVSPMAGDLYNVDDQYFAHTVVLFLIQLVWDDTNADTKSYLLHKLADVVGQYDPSVLFNHIYLSNVFCDYMAEVEKARHNTRKIDLAVQKFLHTHAQTPEQTLFQYHAPRVWKLPEPIQPLRKASTPKTPITSHRKRFRKCFDDYSSP